MASFNKVILVGNLTADPELKYIPSGTAVCQIRLAVNERFKKGDEWVDSPVYVDIAVWGKQAESCAEYLKKGSSALFEGRLRFDSWEDKDGSKRNKLSVTADRVQFLGGKSDSSESARPPMPDGSQEDPDDDLPF